MSAYRPIEDRLKDKAKLNPETHCIEWQGALDRYGYGKINGGKDMPNESLAHRAAFRCWSGDIPEGCDIDHRCQNTRCINPSHLQAIPRRVHVKYADYKKNNRNRLKTHCHRGHPFDDSNTLISSSKRYCRACMKARRAVVR